MSAEDEDFRQLRVPPHSIEAEQSVLGGLMLDNRAWDRVGDIVADADLYRFEHRTIYAAIKALILAAKPADVITVHEQLKRSGKADEIGGMTYLNSLTSSTPSASNIRSYATIVRELSMKRKFISTLDEAMGQAWGAEPITKQLDHVASAISSLERARDDRSPTPLADIVIKRIDHIQELNEGKVEAGWPVFLPQLTRLLNGGLRPGGVYVIAARPSVGKSALAAAIGLALARDQELPVLFLSQEMGEDEMGDRAIANLGGVDYGRIQTGQLQDIEWGSLSEAVEIGAQIPFYIDDQPALTLSQIRSKARQVKGLKVLVLDYLQLSEATGDHRGNRNGAVEEISRGLKQLAKEMGIAILLLSQLNREVEKRTHKRPILADLRDSGAIEQDADVVIFLFPIKELKAEQCMEVGIDIVKNRQGRKDAFALNFWGAHMRWAESAYRLKDLLQSKAGGAPGFE